MGESSTPLERAKIKEMTRYIVDNHNHGTRSPRAIELNEKFHKTSSLMTDFYAAMNTDHEADEEDSVDTIIANTQTFKYNPETESLDVVAEACGARPSMDILETDAIYVFDFKNEVYLWKGLRCSPAHHKSCLASI